jgi:integrase
LKDAQLWAKRVEVAIERGEATGTSRAVLGELIERYRRTVTPLKKGAYAENLRLLKWAKHPFAGRDAHSIKPIEIAEWRDERMTQVANNTVRLELAALSVVFQEAKQEWGFSTLNNPVHLIRRPPPGKGRDRRLEGDELVRVISHSESPMLGEIVSLAIETSMRLSEIVSLRWENIELDRAIAKLPKTKNGEVRYVPLSSTALQVLRSMKVAREGLVFPIRSHGVTVAFRRAVARAKIADLHFHDLRHEATSRLVEKGLSVMEVATITGHKTLSMLMRYTHLRPESLLAKLG